jgi:hypothetical protein
MAIRIAKTELRRWCPIAGTHQDADDNKCGFDDCYEDKPTHNLRLRKMLVCSECRQGYFDKKDFADHECWSAY